MKKFSWIAALIVALTFVFTSCDDGGKKRKDPPPPPAGKADPIDVEFTQSMLDVWGGGDILAEADKSGFTFTYGTGGDNSHGNAVAMFKVNLGEAQVRSYEKVTFTFTGISGDLGPSTGQYDVGTEKGVNLLAADNKDKMKNFGGNDADLVTFIVNAFTGSADGKGINAAGAKIGTQPAAIALELAIGSARPQAKNTGEVWFSFYLHASPVKYNGSTATDEKTSFKISNVSFVPLKVALGDDGEDEEEVEPPPVITIVDATSATHDNFKFEKSSSTHGTWDGTDNEDNTFSAVVQGGIRYKFPADTDTFKLSDYDFVEVTYTASSVVDIVVKQYNSGGDLDVFAGDISNGTDQTIRIELRYASGGGFAIQKWRAGAEMTIAFTKVTFIKGTRYAVDYSTGDAAVAPPTTPAFFVDGTKVGNTLPTLVRSGYIHLGWAISSTNLDANTNVTAALFSGTPTTLTARWKVATVQAAQSVVFSSSNLFKKGSGGQEPDFTVVDTPTTGIGYTVSTHSNSYGNSWVYFTYTFTGTSRLSDFNKVTFKYKGETGDIGGKQLTLAVNGNFASASNYMSFESAATPISRVAVDGTAEQTLSMTINQGAATAYDSNATMGFAFGIHGDDYSITITDVKFEQN